MKIRAAFGLFALLAFGVGSAGCGGGGGGGGTPPTAAPTGPTPSPGFTGSRPAADGDAFAYAGAMTLQYVRPPQTVTPLPSPNPPNTVTTTSTVSQQVTVSSGATFQARTNLFDFKIVETDVAPVKTTTLVTDEYHAYATVGGSTAVSIVGSVTKSSDGVTYQAVYGPGNGLLDVLPEATGRIGNAANNAALVTTETDPDGQITSRSVNPDGTYIEDAQFADGTTSEAVQNANGTGSYSNPFVIAGTSYGNGVAPPNTVLSVAQPVTDANGTYIPVSIAYSYGATPAPSPSAVPLPTPTPVLRMVQPVWYPGGTIPTVLSQETYVNAGAAAPPAACSVPAALLGGRATNQLVQSITRIDIVFGETETQVTTSYTAAGLGVVCMQISDILTHYYDFSGQSVKTFATSGTPLQTDTLTETLTLQSAAVTAATSRTAQSLGLSAASGFLPALTSARLALERERIRRHAQAFRAFHRAVWGTIR